MRRLLLIFPLLFLLSACPSLEVLRNGLAGKDLIKLELLGDHPTNISDLSKVDLRGFSISDFQNKRVKKHIRYYLRHGRPHVAVLLKRSAKYLSVIKKIFKEQGIPLDLAYLPLIESSFNPKAVSSAYAVGLWQFLYTTGKIYGLKADYWVDYRMDVFLATKAAAYHLKYLYKVFGDWSLVLAAYNAGAGRIERGMKRYKAKNFWQLSKLGDLSEETIDYVPKFIAITTIVKNAEKYGFSVPKEKQWEEMVPYELKDATDISLLAKIAKMDEKEFREINLAAKRFATPPSSKFTIYIPRSSYEDFVSEMAKISTEDRVTFRRYFVKMGDNLTFIAKKFSIPINPIAQINHFHSLNDIKAGEYIIVPIKGLSHAKNLDKKMRESQPPKKSSNIAMRAKKNDESSDQKEFDDLQKKSKIHEFFHLVTPEDTLYIIALRYGLSLEQVMRWNGIKHIKQLRSGRLLYLKKEIMNENLDF